jgi:hypothetical protein
MRRISVKCEIKASRDKIYDLFWDIKRWSSVWNPIEKVSVTFDNGLKQEFLMDVWRNGQCEKIKTIRYKKNGNIEFHSPTPPPMLSFHSGEWNFYSNGDVTTVESVRYFEMKEDTSDIEPLAFENDFKERLYLILQKFKEHFE